MVNWKVVVFLQLESDHLDLAWDRGKIKSETLAASYPP